MSIRLLTIMGVVLLVLACGDGVSGKKCPKKPKGNAVISVLTADLDSNSAVIDPNTNATCSCNNGKWVKYYFSGQSAP